MLKLSYALKISMIHWHITYYTLFASLAQIWAVIEHISELTIILVVFPIFTIICILLWTLH